MLKDTSALRIESIIEEARQPKAPAYIEPAWWPHARYKGENRGSSTQWIVKQFVLGKFKGKVLDHCCNGRHIYSTRKNGTELWLFKDNPANKFRFCVAKKVNGAFIGNASSLSWMRQNGKLYNLSGRNERIQKTLRSVMPMVPFQMLKENRFDINTLKIIDRGPEEKLKLRSRDQDQAHFTGAMLFSIDGKKGEKQYFLFDIDRGDLEQGVFNPFLSKLAKPCHTIAEAYDSMKPEEVRNAERFLKRPCPRQGEWFFIPVAGNFTPAREKDWYGRQTLLHAEAILQSKGNRPHYAAKLSEEGYVTGKVKHGGHEHPDLLLEGWHKPVPNSSVQSFTITGGID